MRTERNDFWHLAVIVVGALCALLVSGARADAVDAAAEAGPLVRVGEVEGRTFNEHRSSFDARGAAFVTKAGDAVRVWDAGTLKPITAPLLHRKLKAFVISGDGRTVLTRDREEARLWDVATSAVRSVIRPGRGELKFAEISPDGSRVVTVDDEDLLYVNVWRAADRQLLTQLLHDGDNPGLSAQFDRTGTRIVSYRASAGTFRMHYADGRKGDLGSYIPSDESPSIPYVAQFDPRGGQFVFPERENFVIVDCDTGGRTIKSRFREASLPARLFFSADGSRISVVVEVAGMGRAKVCQVFDANTGKFQRSFAPGMKICRLFGPGGKLAICNDYVTDEPDRPAELWDVDAGKVLQRIPDEYPREASPDGKTLLFHTPDERRTSVWRLRD